MKWVMIMIYVLSGQERFMMDEKINELKKEFNCSQENMNCNVYYGDKPCMQDVYEDYCTVPFFNDFKMIIVNNPLFLTTKKGVKSEDEENYLIKCLEQQSEEVILVFFYEGEDLDNRKKVVKLLKKDTKFIQFEKMSYHKIKEFTRKAFKKRGCTISDSALEILIVRTGGDIMNLSSECDKLSLYKQDIDCNDVLLLVSRPLEDRVFELTAAIVKKDTSMMISVYRDLMVLNQEPIALVLMIASKIRAMYQVKVLSRKGYTDKEMITMIGMNPYYLKRLLQEISQFEIDVLEKMLVDLQMLDEKMKSGQIDKKLGLELFMLKL